MNLFRVQNNELFFDWPWGRERIREFQQAKPVPNNGSTPQRVDRRTIHNYWLLQNTLRMVTFNDSVFMMGSEQPVLPWLLPFPSFMYAPKLGHSGMCWNTLSNTPPSHINIISYVITPCQTHTLMLINTLPHLSTQKCLFDPPQQHTRFINTPYQRTHSLYRPTHSLYQLTHSINTIPHFTYTLTPFIDPLTHFTYTPTDLPTHTHSLTD